MDIAMSGRNTKTILNPVGAGTNPANLGGSIYNIVGGGHEVTWSKFEK